MALKYLNRFNNSSVISAGSSVLFNGSNQYLSIPNNAAFQLGTGDFTAECWTYATSMPQSFARLLSVAGTYGGSNVGLEINISTSAAPINSIEFTINGNNTTYFRISTNSAISINTWYHVAVTRLSGTIYCFLNGVLQTSSTSGASTNINGSGGATIAAAIGGGGYWPGYVSNVRILKGTALYTASFTAPTTPLTAVASCSLLTCQSPTIIDNSGNNFAITNNNTATVSSAVTPFTAVLAAPSGVRFLNRNNVPTVSGTQNAIFGYGLTSVNVSITNLVSNTGVVAGDTTGVGTVRQGVAAAGYGNDKAIFGYGWVVGSSLSMTNLVSNAGVVATDTTGIGTSRGFLAAAGYGVDKAIFGYGYNGSSIWYAMTNLVSNAGVVATDTTGVGTSRGYIAAAKYGSDKAIFGYGYAGSLPGVSITNLVSNTGVVATDTTGIGTQRHTVSAAGYGADKAIFGYGYSGSDLSMTNLVSNTGVVASDTTGVGTARRDLAAAGYGLDKAIFGYGWNGSVLSMTNLVSNTGTVATDITGVGTARRLLAAAGYSANTIPATSNFKISKIYADPALITTGLTLYFDAGNASSYPGSGTTWTDLTGNGNTGTLANGPTYTGSFGGGIVFDGTNDQVNIPSTYIPIKFGTSAYSIEMWIRPASITNRQGLVCTDGGSGTAPVFAIQGQGTNGAVGCGTFSFGDTVNTGTNNGVSLNQWAHVVLSRASTASNDAFIYINSTLKATGTLSTNYSGTYGVAIGYTPTAGEYFSGTIAIVRIYKGYALSSSDVLQNYNLTKTRFGL